MKTKMGLAQKYFRMKLTEGCLGRGGGREGGKGGGRGGGGKGGREGVKYTKSGQRCAATVISFSLFCFPNGRFVSFRRF